MFIALNKEKIITFACWETKKVSGSNKQASSKSSGGYLHEPFSELKSVCVTLVHSVCLGLLHEFLSLQAEWNLLLVAFHITKIDWNFKPVQGFHVIFFTNTYPRVKCAHLKATNIKDSAIYRPNLRSHIKDLLNDSKIRLNLK